MILEVLLIAAIIGIFVIVARRLPEALREGQTAAPAPSVPSAVRLTGATSFLGNLLKKTSAPTEQSATPPSSVSSTVLSDESLLTEGDQYLKEGKLREAERSFLRAVAKNPKNPKLYNRLGAIYLKQRNFSDALEAFTAARDLDSSKASRHYNVALAAWQSGKRPLAREAIAEALSLDPTAEKYLQLKKEIEG